MNRTEYHPGAGAAIVFVLLCIAGIVGHYDYIDTATYECFRKGGNYDEKTDLCVIPEEQKGEIYAHPYPPRAR